jgi:hypothetical protein
MREIQIEGIKTIEEAITCIAIYNAMIEVYDFQNTGGKLDKSSYNWEKSVFVININNAAMVSVLRISNILGQNAENLHWKKIIFDSDNVKKKFILSEFGDESEWIAYHNSLVGFRNNFVAHKINNISEVLPILSKSKNILINLYKVIISEIFEDQSGNNITDYNFTDISSVYDVIYEATLNLYKDVDFSLYYGVLNF